MTDGMWRVFTLGNMLTFALSLNGLRHDAPWLKQDALHRGIGYLDIAGLLLTALAMVMTVVLLRSRRSTVTGAPPLR
jgi:hypothetical protein